MNFNPVIRRRLALVSAFSAALIATGYAASEHNRADSLECSANTLEAMVSTQIESSAADVEAAADESPLPKVRQAARDYIQEAKPGSKIDGVFTLSYYGRDSDLYIAGVDATVDGQRRTIDLLVRLYTRKSGGTYWRAESIGRDRAAAMMKQAGNDGFGE